MMTSSLLNDKSCVVFLGALPPNKLKKPLVCLAGGMRGFTWLGGVFFGV